MNRISTNYEQNVNNTANQNKENITAINNNLTFANQTVTLTSNAAIGSTFNVIASNKIAKVTVSLSCAQSENLSGTDVTTPNLKLYAVATVVGNPLNIPNAAPPNTYGAYLGPVTARCLRTADNGAYFIRELNMFAWFNGSITTFGFSLYDEDKNALTPTSRMRLWGNLPYFNTGSLIPVPSLEMLSNTML